MSGPHVLLTTEGTYPHMMGGVGTWCESLVKALDDVDFTVFALMMNPFVKESYERPANVDLVGCPIWGVEEPAEFNPAVSPRRLLVLSALMDEHTARNRFVPILREMLEMIIGVAPYDPRRFGELLYLAHVYFRDHDYRATFRTRAVWECFRELLLIEADELDADDVWEDTDPEADPSPQEVFQRFNQLRGLKVAGDTTDTSVGHHTPRLFEATESMRLFYRLLTPLNYEIPETDLVHATAAGFCSMPGIVKKVESGTPFIITEHGVFMREQMLFLGRIGFPYHLRRFFIQTVSAVARAAYHHADQISPVCSYNARWEAANGATPEQIHVIYNGSDTEVFKPREVTRPSQPTVIMLSRVDILKDIETGLRVAARVREEIPDVRFLHFGPAHDIKYLEEMEAIHEELELGETFEFMGTTDDPAGALNMGDVQLLSSMSEAFPYTVIESMLCGLPVVSTNVGGVPEAVGDLGHTARIRDVEGLARGVVSVLRLPDEEHQELREACRQRAVELFSIRDAMDDYRGSYTRLLDEGRPAIRSVPALPEPVAERAAEPTIVGIETAAPVPPAPVGPPEPELVPEPSRPGPTVEPTGPAEPQPARPAAAEPELVPVAAIAPAPPAPTSADEVRRGCAAPSAAHRRVAVAHAHLLETGEAVRLLSQLIHVDPDVMVRMEAAASLNVLLGVDEAAG